MPGSSSLEAVMSFSETAPPAQNRPPSLSSESTPRSQHGPSGSPGHPSVELDSMILQDPFESSFAPDPFPPAAGPAASEPPPAGTVFERYHKLIAAAESARDHESAILAALDSAILGLPRSAPTSWSRAGSTASERAPHRPRLRSFNFERDVDWSEEPPKVRDHGSEGDPEAKPKTSASTAPAPLASEVAVVFDGPLREPLRSKSADASELARKKRTFVAVSVAAALVVGFTLGFVTGRGDERPANAETTEAANLVAAATAPTRAPEPAVPASLVESAPSAVATPTETVEGAPTAAVPPPALVQEPPARPAEPAALVGRRPAAPQATVGFDSRAALASLSKAGARAGVCVPPGEPGGSVVATVTFGRKGHVEDVSLSSATFRGSYSSDCIKGVLASVRVRPFFGESIAVRKTLTIR
ncbi:MAG TPA: hypothetical protein VFQ35_06425 [Polyangiaceae bacterium]|nr:hypothetical protein [Polyangiaceae bacterium]